MNKSIALLLGFITGVTTTGLGHILPNSIWIIATLIALSLYGLLQLKHTIFNRQQTRLLQLMLFAFACISGMGYGQWRLSLQLADRITLPSEKQDAQLLVRVVGISDGVAEDELSITQTSNQALNTNLAARTHTEKPTIQPLNHHWQQEVLVLKTIHASQFVPSRLLLGVSQGFNGKGNVAAPAMQAGEVWQINVRIKPAHSLASTGAFDIEKWLLTRHIGGLGSVLKANLISDSDPTTGVFQYSKDKIDRYRQTVRAHFALLGKSNDTQSTSVLLGLLTGDRALITPATTLLYQQMGISHLLAISGPHVVLAAGMLTWLFLLLLNKFAHVYLRMERMRWVLPIFLCSVVIYALLAGWQLPAQRTVLMVSIAAVLKSMRLNIAALHLLTIAAFILLLIDPLAVLSAGFWLSFGAVLVLVLMAQRYRKEQARVNQKQPLSAVKSNKTQPTHGSTTWQIQRTSIAIKAYIHTNILLFILLLPLVSACFGKVSVVSPFINMLTIPLFGVVIVPLNLLALLLWHLSPTLADMLWGLLITLLGIFHHTLETVVAVFPQVLVPFQLSTAGLIAAIVTLAIILLPKGLLPKWLIIPCLLVVILPARSKAPLTVQILDVGQGLSVVLQTKHHVMLYDTGSKMPYDRLGMGEKVVLPNLYTQGIRHLDKIMLSHLDNDHSGGTDAILAAIPVGQLTSSKPYNNIPTEYCHAGQAWQWDGVDFKVLAPWDSAQTPDPNNASDNDNSCVLLVSAPTADPNKKISILLMGDAGSLTEEMLVLLCTEVNADILVLGHHGSRFSSTSNFLTAVNPKRAVVSAGFLNRYHHPAPSAIDRVLQQHIPIDETETGGSLTYYLGGNQSSTQSLQPTRYRDKWLWLNRQQRFVGNER